MGASRILEEEVGFESEGDLRALKRCNALLMNGSCVVLYKIAGMFRIESMHFLQLSSYGSVMCDEYGSWVREGRGEEHDRIFQLVPNTEITFVWQQKSEAHCIRYIERW